MRLSDLRQNTMTLVETVVEFIEQAEDCIEANQQTVGKVIERIQKNASTIEYYSDETLESVEEVSQVKNRVFARCLGKPSFFVCSQSMYPMTQGLNIFGPNQASYGNQDSSHRFVRTLGLNQSKSLGKLHRSDGFQRSLQPDRSTDRNRRLNHSRISRKNS